jgi:hypothetical protein
MYSWILPFFWCYQLHAVHLVVGSIREEGLELASKLEEHMALVGGKRVPRRRLAVDFALSLSIFCLRRSRVYVIGRHLDPCGYLIVCFSTSQGQRGLISDSGFEDSCALVCIPCRW